MTLSRRLFVQALPGLLLLPDALSGPPALADDAPQAQVERLQLTRNAWVPNNEKLPVLLYRQVLDRQTLPAPTATRQRFQANRWPPQWVAGIYDYHHYHSTAHEALGVISGKARIVLGGPGGHEVELAAGDVALLPAGTGHCSLDSSDDFLVVGGYPEGQHWDICRTAPTAEMQRHIDTAPYPASDPVFGPNGPLLQAWTARNRRPV